MTEDTTEDMTGPGDTHPRDQVGDLREEAERLVSAGMAAFSHAMRGIGPDTPVGDLAQRFLGGWPGTTQPADQPPADQPPAEQPPAEQPPADQPGRHFATGTPECCVCPVCRGIAAVRNPSPQMLWKVAGGVSDAAFGVASVLRTVERRLGGRPASPTPRNAGPTWRAATRAADATAPGRAAGGSDDPWRAATVDPSVDR